MDDFERKQTLVLRGKYFEKFLKDTLAKFFLKNIFA